MDGVIESIARAIAKARFLKNYDGPSGTAEEFEERAETYSNLTWGMWTEEARAARQAMISEPSLEAQAFWDKRDAEIYG